MQERQELPLHSQKSLLLGLRHEVSKTRMALALDRNIRVLWNFYDLPVKNVRQVLGAGDPDKRTFTIGASRVGDVTKPSAVLTEHPHRVKI